MYNICVKSGKSFKDVARMTTDTSCVHVCVQARVPLTVLTSLTSLIFNQNISVSKNLLFFFTASTRRAHGEGPPLDESDVRGRVLYEHLCVRYLAQGSLSSLQWGLNQNPSVLRPVPNRLGYQGFI